MLSKSLRCILFFGVAIGMLFFNYFQTEAQAQVAHAKTYSGVNAPTVQMGFLYTQPVDPNGKLLLSSWLEPDGSDFDQYIWDNFTLQSNETLTDIEWIGGYDPLRFGGGGAVVNFTVAIYPSIAAGTEPAIANPPLVEYQTGGNAGETSIGMVGGNAMYAYTFNLPTPFIASANVKYWVQIEAFQMGSVPDWCLATGSGGDGRHFQRGAGAGGDTMYRFAPYDAAFTLLGSVSNTITPASSAVATLISTHTPLAMPTDTLTLTPAPTATPASVPQNPPCFSLAIAFGMVLLGFRLPNR